MSYYGELTKATDETTSAAKARNGVGEKVSQAIRAGKNTVRRPKSIASKELNNLFERIGEGPTDYVPSEPNNPRPQPKSESGSEPAKRAAPKHKQRPRKVAARPKATATATSLSVNASKGTYHTSAKAPTREERSEALDWLVAATERAREARRVITEIVLVSPALASVLLDVNPSNRTMSEQLWRSYSEDMRAGRWETNGQGLIVADTGELNDGQHRCRAILHAGVSVEMSVVIGVSRDSRRTVDFGRVRLAADVIGMGGVANARRAAAISAALIRWDLGISLDKGGSGSISRSRVVDYYAEHSAEIDETRWLLTKETRAVFGSDVPLALAYIILRRLGATQRDAEEFFEPMVTGQNLIEGSPQLLVRSRFIRDRRQLGTGGRRLEILLRAWNFWRRGERPRVIPIMDNIPSILI